MVPHAQAAPADKQTPALQRWRLRRCLPHAVHRPHCLAKLKQPSDLPWGTGGERHMSAGRWPFQRGVEPWRLSSCKQNGQVLTISTLMVSSELLNAV